MSTDFTQIASAALSNAEGLLAEWFPNGRRISGEFRMGDIRGGEGNSLAVSLGSGAWQDFATSERGGDLISLLAASRSIRQSDAADIIAQRLSLPVNGHAAPGQRPRAASAAPADDWTPLLEAPVDAPARPDGHYQLGTPAGIWTYFTASGAVIGHIYRFDTAGGKQILPCAWCQHPGQPPAWRWKHFAKPRPLYRLPALAGDPKPVLIVEGEKTADYAAGLLPSYAVLSWPGGAQAVRHADWTPLTDRAVFVWPDADEAGRQAAGTIASILPDAVILRVPDGWQDGYDLADAARDGWTVQRAEAHIAQERQRISDEYEAARQGGSEPEQPPEPEAQPYTNIFDSLNPPFRILGFDRGVYYYLPTGSQQITRLEPAQHNRANLITLAPAGWWGASFPTQQNTPDWSAAANALIQTSYHIGLFNPDKIRGRGCWVDDSRTVFHAGESLVCDGARTPLAGFRSKYLYERAPAFTLDDAPAAGNAEASRLIRLCSLLPWQSPLYSKLLAGWCAVAPISGCLSWRPHIWITGPAGSGKSWTLTNIVEPIAGKFALRIQGTTSEAGIRQTLGSDARPILIDEAESEDDSSRARFRSVLNLARQASTEGGGSILKGTINGTAQEFNVRSCFCFASIGVAAVNRADTSRISVLTLSTRGANRDANFQTLQSEWQSIMENPDFGSMVRARSIANAVTIRENARVFAYAVGLHLGDQRTGDQLGTLLAGAFSLTSTRIATADYAKGWVKEQDWTGFAPEEIDKDENQAFTRLLDHIVFLSPTHRVSIGELLNRVFSLLTSPNDRANAIEAIELIGIRANDGTSRPPPHGIFISNSHAEIAKIFEKTPWSGKWKDQLGRVNGAEHIPAYRFGAVRQRAVFIPTPAFIQPADE